MQKKFFYRRLLRYFAAFMLPVLVVLGIMTAIWNARVTGEIKDEGKQMISSASLTVEQSLSNIADQNAQLANTPNMLLALKSILNESHSLSYRDAINMRSLNSMLRSSVKTYSYVISIYLYLDGHDLYYTSDANVADLDLESDWWIDYQSMPEDAQTQVFQSTVDQYGQTSHELIVIQRFLNHTGCVVMKIDTDAFLKLLDNSLGGDGRTVLFLNPKGSPILAWRDTGNASAAFYDGDEGAAKALELAGDGIEGAWIRLGGGTYMVHQLVDSGYGIRILSLISNSRRVSDLLAMAVPMLLVFLAGTVAVILVSWAATKRSFGYLNRVVNLLSDAEKGIYPESAVAAAQTPADEYSVILSNILFLYLKNQKLNADLTEKEHERETAQLSALQAQINPHFLFNTLQTIQAEAALSTPESAAEVQRLTQSLADILKYSLADPMTTIPLSEEILYLKRYVAIQKSRFGDKFIIYYDVEENLLDFPVFRLMLQPLIENSILHGVRYREGRGHIKLTAFERKGRVIFRVVDDGIGMDRVHLSELRESINRFSVHNVGLANVNCRLKLYFGEESGLKIRSKSGWGTVVEFSIPEGWKTEKQLSENLDLPGTETAGRAEPAGTEDSGRRFDVSRTSL